MWKVSSGGPFLHATSISWTEKNPIICIYDRVSLQITHFSLKSLHFPPLTRLVCQLNWISATDLSYLSKGSCQVYLLVLVSSLCHASPFSPRPNCIYLAFRFCGQWRAACGNESWREANEIHLLLAEKKTKNGTGGIFVWERLATWRCERCEELALESSLLYFKI